MAEALLRAEAPFGAPHRVSTGDAELSLVPNAVLVHVAARLGMVDRVRDTLSHAYGLDLPLRPRRNDSSSVGAIWAGPDQWFLTGAVSLSEVEGHLAGVASVTDLSDARTVIRISGPGARELLARHVPIDLHPRAFHVGDVAITHANHIGIVMWQTSEAPVYELACFRSFADTLWRWLGSHDPA